MGKNQNETDQLSRLTRRVEIREKERKERKGASKRGPENLTQKLLEVFFTYALCRYVCVRVTSTPPPWYKLVRGKFLGGVCSFVHETPPLFLRRGPPMILRVSVTERARAQGHPCYSYYYFNLRQWLVRDLSLHCSVKTSIENRKPLCTGLPNLKRDATWRCVCVWGLSSGILRFRAFGCMWISLLCRKQ